MIRRPPRSTLYPDTTLVRSDMGPPAFGSEVELHGLRFLRVSMGNPHAVAFLGSEEEVEGLDLRGIRSEEHTSELQSRQYLACRLLLEKKNRDTTGYGMSPRP